MKTVRAKFRVSAIERRIGTVWIDGKAQSGEVQTITLNPVTGGSDENKSFFASTPSGEIKLGTVNVEAAQVFQLEHEYYIDFTPAV